MHEQINSTYIIYIHIYALYICQRLINRDDVVKVPNDLIINCKTK